MPQRREGKGSKRPRSDRPERQSREPGVEARPKPRVVRKVRSEHGTRVARSIICSRCGASDTIHFAPKDPARAFCRRCAADVLGIEDPDTKVASPVSFVCSSCGRPGTTLLRPKPGELFVCEDCLRGIESKQSDKTKKATRLSSGVVRVRRS